MLSIGALVRFSDVVLSVRSVSKEKVHNNR